MPKTHKTLPPAGIRLLIVCGGSILLALLLAGLAANTRQVHAATIPAEYTSSGQKIFKLHINKGSLTDGPRKVTVNRGDRLQFIITSSNQEEGDIRIAGYGQNSGIESNSISGFEFTADKSGLFQIEIRQEEDGKETAALQWKPLGTLVVKQ